MRGVLYLGCCIKVPFTRLCGSLCILSCCNPICSNITIYVRSCFVLRFITSLLHLLVFISMMYSTKKIQVNNHHLHLHHHYPLHQQTAHTHSNESIPSYDTSPSPLHQHSPQTVLSSYAIPPATLPHTDH